MAIRLIDVARLAGVSLTTASRVVNGSDRVPAADVAQRVRAAASELGYVANAQAQALARSSTGLLGLVVHDIADPYFSTIARGVTQVARECHRQVLLSAAQFPDEDEAAAVAAFTSYRTEAIILAGSRAHDADAVLSSELTRYVANGGRLVSLGFSPMAGSSFVDIANEAGSFDLASALISRGVSRFAVLSGPPALATATERTAGFLRALAQAGLKPLAVRGSRFTRQGGFDAAVECWQATGGRTPAGEAPLCLLAANDVMALGAISGLRSLNLAVPADVLVAGFDDIPTLRDYVPGLTTCRLPLERIGREAARLALDHTLEGPVAIRGEVVIRASTG